MSNSQEQTGWFSKAGYGFFIHHHHAPSLAKWNTITDQFDTDKLASQFNSLGGKYAFLTLGQNTGYFCSPNAVLQKLLGKNNKCSDRDLFLDFAKSLEKYDLRALAYTTSMGPAKDLDAIQILRNIPPWNTSNAGNYQQVKQYADNDPRLKHFLNLWEDIHRNWALRWGKHLSGWWVDGCYHNQELYSHPDTPNAESFAAALRAGNPQAIIAFNPGVVYPPRRVNAVEDYTAGEINNPWKGVCDQSVIDGLQYHILTFAGQFWGEGQLRFSPQELATITRNITSRGGVISWDLPWNCHTGCLDNVVVDAFLEMRKILESQSGRMSDVSVKQLKPPLWNSNGQRKSGLVQIETATDTQIQACWQNEKITLKKTENNTQTSTYECELTAPQSMAEQKLQICQEQWMREFPIAVKKNVTPDFLLQLAASDEIIATICLKKIDNKVRFVADIQDPEPRITPVCWQGSCLEIFVQTRENVNPEQLVCLPDATVYKLLNDNWTSVTDYQAQSNQHESGYHLQLDWPENLFRFNIQVTVARDCQYHRSILAVTDNVLNADNYLYFNQNVLI